jgi:hypothetical protein
MKVGATLINMDCEPMAREGMEFLVKNTSKDAYIFLTDNGSIIPPERHPDYDTFYIPRNDGVNLVWYKLKKLLQKEQVDVLVCGHADFFILEKDWDKKVLQAFEEDDRLVLAGFVGSGGIGSNGGRTHGVYLNFMGGRYQNGNGSPHHVHGQRITQIIPAACFDHCCMIYKVSEFDQIKSWFPNAPPMHFEDRILPTAANYHGYRCALIGVDCDHISGAKATGMNNYYTAVARWLDDLGWPHPEDGNYDCVTYLEAERQFLSRWRDELKFVPFRVNSDYSLTLLSKGTQ